MATISTADFKNGMCIVNNGKMCTIVEFQHVKPGKGGAFVRTKLKDIKTGRVINESFLKNAPAELSSSSIYMMAVDDENGDIYIGVSGYSSNGNMYRFRKDGTFVEMFDCGGLNPRTAVFVD